MVFFERQFSHVISVLNSSLRMSSSTTTKREEEEEEKEEEKASKYATHFHEDNDDYSLSQALSNATNGATNIKIQVDKNIKYRGRLVSISKELGVEEEYAERIVGIVTERNCPYWDQYSVGLVSVDEKCVTFRTSEYDAIWRKEHGLQLECQKPQEEYEKWLKENYQESDLSDDEDENEAQLDDKKDSESKDDEHDNKRQKKESQEE
jgi:hypothetical protein